MADVKKMMLGSGVTPSATPAASNHSVDAATDGVGWSLQARGTEAITHIGFRYGVRTGTPPTFVATLESVVSTTGLPDGTDIGGGSPTAATFTPPADATWDGTFQWVALTNSYTPTRGQVLAITIRHSSGTIDGSNNSSFTSHYNNFIGTTNNRQFPMPIRLTAGTWSKQNNSAIFGVRTATTRYGFPIQDFYVTRSASTVGHRQALKFTLPADSGDTFTVIGARLNVSLSGAAGKNPVLGLWSASGVIQDITLDADWVNNASSSYTGYDFYFNEASLTALSFGTAYYLGLEVGDAVNGGVIVNGLQLASADDQDAFAGGSDFVLSTFDGATWTDDATVRPFVEPIISDITEPAGGGGTTIAGTPMRRGMI